MKTTNLIILVVLTTLFVGCTQSQKSEQQTTVEEVDSTEVYTPEPEFDSVNLVIEETVQPIEPVSTPTKKETSSSSYSSSSYSSSYNDNSGDYWEEKRKTSPNDNYLLGFDEDVDDVHDMEIYMEDY